MGLVLTVGRLVLTVMSTNSALLYSGLACSLLQGHFELVLSAVAQQSPLDQLGSPDTAVLGLLVSFHTLLPHWQ